MPVHNISSADDLHRILSEITPDPTHHLGDILVEANHLTRDQLDRALQEQQRGSKRLGEVLLDMGLASKEQINAALARKLGIPFVALVDYEITPQVLSLVPADIAQQYNVLPLTAQNTRLVVAMENPLDWEALEVLRFNTNRTIEPVITSRQEISAALDKYYRQHSEQEIDDMLDDMQLQPLREHPQEALHVIEKEARKKPIVRLVNAIVTQAIVQKASDINIRPEKDRVNIYYRIDGRLQFSRTLSRALLAPLVSRIKITGHMNIAERRLPQDGHARVRYEGAEVDLRISVIPTVDGESVVIRVLDKRAGVKPLDELGLSRHDDRNIRELLSRNYGIFLVTGPTGSGKSTTLYALLNHLKGRNPHVITVEDPVEYGMQGVEQIQINPPTGYTFAEALRHILRHDPDVIMVGEIRDLETARIANKAALTGHLVLSTLHTNDAASAVTRLIDMGIEPYLLSSTLLGVMAQRLVRLNCPHCKAREKTDPEWRRVLSIGSRERFYRGKGCTSCNHTGYQGRTLVGELLTATPEMAGLINRAASTQELRDMAIQNGMTPLTQNALELARAGDTSLEEVFAVRLG